MKFGEDYLKRMEWVIGMEKDLVELVAWCQMSQVMAFELNFHHTGYWHCSEGFGVSSSLNSGEEAQQWYSVKLEQKTR